MITSVDLCSLFLSLVVNVVRAGDYLDIYSERMSSSWVDLSIDDTLKSYQHMKFICATYAVSVKVDEVKKGRFTGLKRRHEL